MTAERRHRDGAQAGHPQLVVLAGAGELDVDGETVALAPGTHHAWSADVPHAYACTSDDELVAVDVVVTPTSRPASTPGRGETRSAASAHVT